MSFTVPVQGFLYCTVHTARNYVATNWGKKTPAMFTATQSENLLKVFPAKIHMENIMFCFSQQLYGGFTFKYFSLHLCCKYSTLWCKCSLITGPSFLKEKHLKEQITVPEIVLLMFTMRSNSFMFFKMSVTRYECQIFNILAFSLIDSTTRKVCFLYIFYNLKLSASKMQIKMLKVLTFSMLLTKIVQYCKNLGKFFMGCEAIFYDPDGPIGPMISEKAELSKILCYV